MVDVVVVGSAGFKAKLLSLAMYVKTHTVFFGRGII